MTEHLLIKVGCVAAGAGENAASSFADLVARALASDSCIRVRDRPAEKVPPWGEGQLRYGDREVNTYQTSPPFTAEVRLSSAALKELDPDRHWARDVTFALAYDGVLFATASQDLADGDVGLACRRLLERVIAQEDRLTSLVIGPSPIHPDIHLRVTRGSEYFEITDWEFDRTRDILTLGVTTIPEHTTEDLVSEFLQEWGVRLTFFYEAQCSASQVGEAYTNAVNAYRELHAAEKQRLDTSAWRRLTARRRRKRVLSLISDVHHWLAEHALEEASLRRESKEFRESLRRTPWLLDLVPYFDQMNATEPVRYEVLLAGIETIRSSHLTSSQNRTVAWSGIVGVILGAVLGAATKGLPLRNGTQQPNPATHSEKAGPGISAPAPSDTRATAPPPPPAPKPQ